MAKRSKGWTGALILACGLSFGPAAFGQQPQQQQQGDQQTGQARVRSREGPRIELKAAHRPVIVALFLNPQQSQQSQGALEITALIPAGGNDPSQAREVVFESRNATENGIVTHRMDQPIGGGGAAAAQQGQQGQQQSRHLIFTARRGGQDVQVQELAGGNNVRILAIRRQDPQQQQGQQIAQGQQGQAQPSQQAQGQQGQPGQTPEQQEQQQAQQQQQQAEQQAQQAAARQEAEQREAAREQNDAVVFVYLQGEQR